jgi:glutathione S-transferase
MVLLIHGSPLSPCTKRVQVVLHEKGIPFEFNPVDLSKGEQKSELHIQKQPFGKVPVLEEDGFVLYGTFTTPHRFFSASLVMRFLMFFDTESRAICQYVAAKYRNQGTDLFPDNDKVEEFSLLQQVHESEAQHLCPIQQIMTFGTRREFPPNFLTSIPWLLEFAMKRSSRASQPMKAKSLSYQPNSNLYWLVMNAFW